MAKKTLGKWGRAYTALLGFSALVIAAKTELDAATALAQTGQSPSTEDYREVVQARGIQSDVVYPGQLVEPAEEAPLQQEAPMASSEPPPVETPALAGSTDAQSMRWIVLAVSVVVLVFLGILLFRNGAGVGVAFSRGDTKEPPARRPKAVAPTTEVAATARTPDDALLQELRDMPDQREAMHRLLVHILAKSASLTGLRPGRSWTARDTIRSVPEGWSHLEALRYIAGQAELAWFGGRDIDRNSFEACLDLARPILSGVKGP